MRSHGKMLLRWVLALPLMAACGMDAGETTSQHRVTEGEIQAQTKFSPTYKAYKAVAREFEEPEEPSLASCGSGMTWRKMSHFNAFNVDFVGCDSRCNAYSGDTSCTESRPILCLKKEGLPNPGVPTDFYRGWTGGRIGLTPPVRGLALTSLEEANRLCVQAFGAGYRMAEHHDGGGGWNWYAYGNVSTATNFWVHILNQPANCWNTCRGGNRPPDCSAASTNPAVLWPPDHSLTQVGIHGVTDPDPSDSVRLRIDTVRQDEPVDGAGDGHTAPDAEGVGTATLRLRAERSGSRQVSGNGRVYHVSFTATDTRGASCQGQVKVCVPHDQGNGSTCVDEGALYNSTSP